MPRAAVLGSPVRHSLSPALHRAAYGALGLADWHYEAIECDEDGLPELLDGLDEQWAGLSLTMPLKRAVIPLLDEVSDLAVRVEAVNTVVLSAGTFSTGHSRGENTDVYGVVAALRDAGSASLTAGDGWAPDGIVLGGGATACSALAAMAGLGARQVALSVRNPGRAGQAVRVAERFGLGIDVTPWLHAEKLVARLRPGTVVVSTVPAGAADALAAELSGLGGSIAEGVLLLDVVYSPWPTLLAQAWVARGGQAVGGLEMLVHQAVEQVELFTGLRPPVDAMRAAGERALAGDPAVGPESPGW